MTPSPTLPPPLLLFGLISFLSLFLISGGTLWILLALGLLILASYILRVRLPSAWLPSLLFGGTLLGLVILSTPTETVSTTTIIGPARATYLFGQAMAILMTIQFYRPTPKDPNRASLIALFSGMLILSTACNALEEKLLRELIPAGVLTLGLALRSVRQRGRFYRALPAFIGIALLASLGTGWMGVKTVQNNRERLTEWGNKFMNERPQNELLGMSQQPTLGASFGARGSTARILRLQGSLQSQHLRGAAFETYSDSRWWPPLNGRSFHVIEPANLALAHPPGDVSERVSVTRLQSGNPLVYFPLETYNLEPGETEAMEWATDSSGPIKITAPAPYTYLYQEGATGSQGLLALPAMKSHADRKRHLQLPEEIQELLTPLAKTITKNSKTPAERVAAVESYLLENYTYSLSFTGGFLSNLPQTGDVEPAGRLMDAKRQDMVLRFLFAQPRQGAHCEFFASSAALLLRCVGVPTRYVTGYFAHEDEGPNQILVRQRDAHAWCEAWVEGKGWVTVEATPPTGWPDKVKGGIEPWRKALEWLEDRWQGFIFWLAEREPLQLGMILLLPFAAIAGLTLWQRRRQKQVVAPLTHLLPPPELATLARRFEAVLPSLTPTEPWSERLVALPEAAQSAAREFVALYQSARFGGKSADRGRLEAALKEVERAAKPG
jgi:transglutaminase-like putative cysteine protease